MMRRKLIGLVLTGAVLLGGCTIEPPLYLRKSVQTKLILTTQVNIIPEPESTPSSSEI